MLSEFSSGRGLVRLGFSVRVYGTPDLPSHDGRPPYREPNLSMSLAYLRDILHYLHVNDIHMYRMHGDLLPGALRLSEDEIRTQIAASRTELAALGDMAREWDIRLSFHPYGIALNTPDEDRLHRAVKYLEMQADLLDAMALGPEAVIVVHVGGVYEDPQTSRERFVRRYEALPSSVKGRLVLENDDHRFAFADIWAIYKACGIPLVFDNLHHLVLNPERMPMEEAVCGALDTWPADVRPKIHFSSPRTEMRSLPGTSRTKAPTWTEHSDFVNPFEFIWFLTLTEGFVSFDVMLESKARDLALLKLREDVVRFAPKVAERLM
ncbi:MAG: UV DNA damage repair endonuclease UvsE [Anaerolineales bacterium]